MMKSLPVCITAAVLAAAAAAWGADAPAKGKNLGAVSGGDFAAQQVIDVKCTTCHGSQVIDTALKQHKDMEKITSSMEKKGVKLSDKERQVLNIFWSQNPYKAK
jgi:hypothetical protein